MKRVLNILEDPNDAIHASTKTKEEAKEEDKNEEGGDDWSLDDVDEAWKQNEEFKYQDSVD